MDNTCHCKNPNVLEIQSYDDETYEAEHAAFLCGICGKLIIDDEEVRELYREQQVDAL